MTNNYDGKETLKMKEKILKSVSVLVEKFRLAIEFLGKHPFVAGVLAILSFLGVVISIVDRQDSKITTRQIEETNVTVTKVLEEVRSSKRNWAVMDSAFHGIKVGGSVKPVYDLNFESVSRRGMGSTKYSEWKLPNGNLFSVIYDSESDRVLKMDIKWNERNSSQLVGISDFMFGQTTLQDIRNRFDSNGFSYAAKVMYTNDEGVVTLNAFELNETPTIIVVFETFLSYSKKVEIDRLPKEDQVLGKIGGYFVLTGISVSDESYLDRVWGEAKIYDPLSKPIVLE